MLKTILSFSALLFCAFVCCITASAETSGEWEYKILSSGNIYITGYSGNSSIVDVPEQLDGRTVVEVYIECFDGHKEIDTVNFSSYIDSIYTASDNDYQVYIKNYNVAEDNPKFCSVDGVVFTEDMTSLKLYPSGRTDEEYVIPDKVDQIMSYAFYKTSLKQIKFPSGLSYLSENAICFCPKLTSVTIPAEYGDDNFETMFEGCSALTDIYVEEGNSDFKSIDGVLYSRYGVTLIKYPNGRKDEKYTVPNSTESIEQGAFNACEFLKEVYIPDSVTNIMNAVFENCTSLEKVRLSENVNTISYKLFSGCSNLKNITLPDSVVDIESYAFYQSGLTEMFIGDNIEYIYEGAFAECGSLCKFTTSDDQKYYYADEDGVLKTYDWLVCYPAGKTDEKYKADCPRIHSYAFCGCENLKEVTLCDGTGTIPLSCFENCTNLQKLNGTDSVIKVETDAFLNTALINDSSDDIVYLGNIAISCSPDITEAVLKEGTTVMADSLFSFCKDLVYASVPEGVTSISDHAFSNCYSLSAVTLPESLTEIEMSAFTDCWSLKNITLPKNLETIYGFAFYGCKALKEIILPEKITRLDIGTFEHCNSLEHIFLPQSISEIDSYAFSNCDSLKNITLPKNLEILNMGIFYGCEGLQTIEIPEKVNSIEVNAFEDCVNLKSVYFHKNISEIGDSSFNGCVSLDGIYYEGTDAQWKKVMLGEENEPLENSVLYPEAEPVDAWSAQLSDSTSTTVVTGSGGVRSTNILSYIIGIPSAVLLVIGSTIMIIRKIKNKS